MELALTVLIWTLVPIALLIGLALVMRINSAAKHDDAKAEQLRSLI